MGGQKFEYDESGSTFFYFVLSFLGLILIPCTFYYWPRKKREDPDVVKEQCQCPQCIKKRALLQNSEPYRRLKSLLIKLVLIGGWALLIFLAYKVSQFDYEMSNFDPYEILGVPLGSSQSEIKRAYHQLSRVLHPDKKTGDEKAFMMLTKAYQALTDDEARKNWERYGNPDGPGAMSFGIALPAWIVEKENSIWVLGLYALIFMIALPTAVGMWWYHSIRFSSDKVLLDTTQMYFYFFHKTPHMALKRVIMILAASLEYDKRHNSQVVERQSDNEEVPLLIRQLPNLNEKCKEMPLCRMYSIKARAILHAHLSRIPLNPDTLDRDRQFIVKKCPYLIQEMVSCVNQLIMLAYAKRISRLPTIETIENCMKLSPMIVQGLWEFKSPLLQLPYLTEDHLRYFATKKRHIKNLQQFAQLPADESRAILKNLSDFEYDTLMKVLGKMPLIDFSFRCEVIDDEHTNVVTAGAIVTVTVTLERKNMRELFGDTNAAEKPSIREEEEDQENGEGNTEGQNQAKRPIWAKQGKKGHKGGKNKYKGGNVKHKVTPNPSNAPKVEEKQPVVQKKQKSTDGAESDVESGLESDEEKFSSDDEKKTAEDDDFEWEKFQQKLNKREKLEGKSKLSHGVHAPYFPEDKQEYWWTYICDRKSRTLLTAPYHVTNLVDREEVQLKFTAPRWPALYTFTVCLRSDSYMGMDQQLDMKLDVKEATAIPTVEAQWEISESESDPNLQGSEYTTDTSEEEEDD
ncbi:translocation protein SEC63 homolog isoform X1 [Lutzomyia longipalpis]|uniref:translocation protein SEC63 homolog isoform X1 n=1 Tax=Lutzomyia longipalpis TaxID=7200 RepID=UPI0024837EE0|nr:translocation protein SEC63 homolog isoform X1 [Lutzomyia longipalpis]